MKTDKIRKLIRKSRLDGLLNRQESRKRENSRLFQLRQSYNEEMKAKL